jgi:hypothetical protein
VADGFEGIGGVDGDCGCIGDCCGGVVGVLDDGGGDWLFC